MMGPAAATEMMTTTAGDGALSSPFGSANPRAAAASDDVGDGRRHRRRTDDDDDGRRCHSTTRGRVHGGGSASSLRSLISSASWTTLLLLQLLVLLLLGTCGVDAGGSRRLRINNNANSRSIGVMNDSGVKIDVFWVNPETKALAESAVGSGIMFGGSSGINSYVGHTFEVQEMPTKAKGCLGPNKQCRKTYFTVSGDEDQVFTIEKDFTVTIENHRTKALKIAQDAINGCTPPDSTSSSLSALEQLDAYANCLSAQLNRTLEAKKEEIEFEKSVRKKMAEKMVLYACDDPKLATTKATRNSTWTYRDESIATASSGGNTAKRIRDVPHRVQVLFESDASTILLVKDFYSAEQCQQLVDVSVDAVHPTENVRVRHRNVPLSAKSKVGPLLAKMYQLVLGYVQTGVEYTHDPMLVLQFHSGTTDSAKGQEECVVSESGESTGACASASTASNATTSGALHKVDDKALAQLRVVCRKSDDLVGGAIHYPKAGVHINPAQPDNELSAGYAVLTVYHDPKTGEKEVDPFVEEHVECPVQHGELVSIVQYFVGPT